LKIWVASGLKRVMCSSEFQENRRHARRLGHAVEIGVDAVEHQHFFLELGVDGAHFLVDRLQFLVGALQLLVGGHEFLVGRLQLLVGGLQFPRW
jgi:hypothetical protein